MKWLLIGLVLAACTPIKETSVAARSPVAPLQRPVAVGPSVAPLGTTVAVGSPERVNDNETAGLIV